MTDDLQWYEVTIGKYPGSYYVEAKSDVRAMRIAGETLKTEVDTAVLVEDFDEIDREIRGDNAPYAALKQRNGHVIEYEKRVNQGGFKGIYQKRHDWPEDLNQ